MPQVDIHGVEVEFPFPPYQVQHDYMSKVIEALDSKRNAVLESPTGTGKTLSLLCSALAWRNKFIKKVQTEGKIVQQQGGVGADSQKWSTNSDDMRSFVPKIIYASRTHSQLTQVVSELKRTNYGKSVNVSVLGSRQQLCVHPTVSKQESNQLMVHMCRTKVHKRLCHYHTNVEDAKTKNLFTTKVMDIEDMVKTGQKWNVCPYYASREVSKQKDCAIVFTPYNYLLDKKSRKAQNLEVSGNIVIIDEAHNLESVCEESSSFELSSLDLAHCIEEMDDILNAVNKMKETGTLADGHEAADQAALSEFNREELALMKQLFLVLERTVDEIELDEKTQSLSKSGSFIFELFSKVNLNFSTYEVLMELLDKTASYLSTLSNQFRTRGVSIQKFSDIVKIVFAPMNALDPDSTSREDELATFYRVHISEKEQPRPKSADVWTSSSKKKMARKLSYWCFSPGYAIKDLLMSGGVRNLILTSGTLTPLNTFISELRLQSPITMSNKHVIDNHQMFVAALQKGPQGGDLKLTYRTRDDHKLAHEIGQSLCMIARASPGGMLVFFASYSAMSNFTKKWEESGIMEELGRIKPVTMESSRRKEMAVTIDSYYSSIRTQKAAVLFAVCRGKVSEGLDFANENGRAVVVLGIPFPPQFDPRVKLKMSVLDDLKRKSSHFKDSLTGNQWYQLQACRAVNQAIGRVIRHRHDYGAIILFDDRYARAQQQAELPAWIRDQVNNFDDFARTCRRLKSFFCSVLAKEAVRLRNLGQLSSLPSQPRTLSTSSLDVSSDRKRSFTQSTSDHIKSLPRFNQIEEHLASKSIRSSSGLTIQSAMSDFECCKHLYDQNSLCDATASSFTSGSSKSTDNNGDGVSLLSALDSAPDGSGFSTINFHNIDSPTSQSTRKDLSQTPPVRPRKKIKIKNPNRIRNAFSSSDHQQGDERREMNESSQQQPPRSTNQDTTGRADAGADLKNQSSSSYFDEAKINGGSARDFLFKLKSYLPTEKFEHVKALTTSLRKTDDVEEFVTSLVELLRTDGNLAVVLRLYLRFIRQPLHKSYRTRCNEHLKRDIWQERSDLYG